MSFNYFNNEIVVINIVSNINFFDNTFMISIKKFFFHYPFPNSCHLWSGFGINNSSNNVTAKSRSYLIQ